MIPNIEISSLSINKLKNSNDDFVKYDMDVSLDEVDSSESEIKLKYKFALLSNPTNTKISVDGIVSVRGNELEISKQLQPAEKNVPVVVNTIYQEIFPMIYIVTKSMQIPCPSYRLSQISSAQLQKKQDESLEMESQEKVTVPEPDVPEPNVPEPNVPETKDAPESPPSESLNTEIEQEANVSSI